METIDRTTCTARYHGTETAFQAHGCRCQEALDAWSRYKKYRAAGIQPPGYVDAIGTRRRLQALNAIGYTFADLSARLGGDSIYTVRGLLKRNRVYPRTAIRVARLYDELSMTPGPCKSSATIARKRGFRPPLYWDDIDNDPEPSAAEDVPDTKRSKDVDWVAVEEACSGRLGIDKLTHEEALTAVARMTEWRLGKGEIADRLGVTTQRVDKVRNTLKVRRTYANRKAREQGVA